LISALALGVAGSGTADGAASAADAVAGAPASAAKAPSAARDVDPPSCRTVRLSDVGWTDVTSTTALTAELLRKIGYSPTITVLSVPVTFASLKNKDIDAFLGNWMPAQVADRAPYDADGSIAVVGPNLFGAKYTLLLRPRTQGLQRHPPLRRRPEPFDLRHRARQRWQQARAQDVEGKPVRPG
jgi:ABC-type proline/glycine betaine transport system substrate-binding protein